MPGSDVHWRADGVYVSTLSSKTSLLDETKVFLRLYAQSGDASAVCRALIAGELPHSSRRTRETIVQVLRVRLVNWQPPSWVLHDLWSFAQDTQSDAFVVALLLHIARQDLLAYEFIQQVVVPRWYDGSLQLIRSDVQSFLDQSLAEHPEVGRWSYSTRERLSQHLLATLRDCTLLKGKVEKQIVLPVVPMNVAHHLIRLLQAEGVPQEEICDHSDWRLWLWEPAQVRTALRAYELQEQRG
jgi:Putative inner membrane protein (DUF1819).